jgi:glycerophosphoryl diester phosphodiesterase
VPPRIAPLLRPQIGFAHRGAKAYERENTLAAFELALRLGATGLETDAWLTGDGRVVLDHDGEVGRWPRRRAIRMYDRADLPTHIPTLDELYEMVGGDVPLSIDVKDLDAAKPIIEIARRVGEHALRNLWLCTGYLDHLVEWRAFEPAVRLVDSTRLKRLREGPERRAARLAELGIDAINMHQSDWTGGLTTLFHRFERYAFAWDLQFERVLLQTLDMGIDAVYSDHVDRMVEAIARWA